MKNVYVTFWIAAILTFGSPAPAQSLDPGAVWAYTLLEGSYLLDDCPICGRPTIRMPLRGTFNLVFQGEDPLFSHYELRDLQFVASLAGRDYKVEGRGTYELGGEVALVQTLQLDLTVNDGQAQRKAGLINKDRIPHRPWPILDVHVDQTNGTLTQVFRIDLVAAPIRELWFSTRGGLTSAQDPSNPKSHYSGGDLLSSTGHAVKRNAELVGPLGIMPVVPDLGLNAVDIRPGGEIVFSINQDIFSERLGPLQQGDLLSNRGVVVQRNQSLTAAFVSKPLASDVGLDAVHIAEDGEILFSIQKIFFSDKLGVTAQRGDLLSNRGKIIRTNKELLSHFKPSVGQDYGLDAVYVWPGGEIWFSTEEGFQSQTAGAVQAGDILSDAGSVVFRNLELLNPFAPIEDLADFGLDALFVITDAAPPAPAPSLSLLPDFLDGNLTLHWQGKGRAFQLEKADQATGPYVPLGPVTPDAEFTDPRAMRNAPQGFYRLRQW